MHVVIMGCGRTGAALARSLVEQDTSVAVIDRDPSSFRRLGNTFAGQTVAGVGFDRKVLTEAGISRADAFVAVSHGDNSNIIAARVARETFGVERVIARIYDIRRAEVYERLGIPTIATVRWSTHRLLRALRPDENPELWRDPTSGVAVIEPVIGPQWIGRSVSDWERETGARIAYITRFGSAILPTGSEIIADSDRLAALVTDDMVARVVAVSARPEDDTQAERPEVE